ncbi:MAG TPA: hypothetical protein VED86_04705 [archaeon]|nr:hypothetical protein [archaeon]
MATTKDASKTPPETEHVDVPTAPPDREHEVSLAENPEPATETVEPTLAEPGLGVTDSPALVAAEVRARVTVELGVVVNAPLVLVEVTGIAVVLVTRVKLVDELPVVVVLWIVTDDVALLCTVTVERVRLVRLDVTVLSWVDVAVSLFERVAKVDDAVVDSVLESWLT